MTTAARLRTFTGLDLLAALRSRWMMAVALVYAALFGLFVWLGLRESSVLGFTGISRVVLNVVNVAVLAMPGVALVATSQSVVRARSSGLLELMLAQPVRRGEWFWGLVASRTALLLGPVAVLLAGAIVWGALVEHDPTVVGLTVRSFAILAALVVAFTGLGVWLSTLAPTEERAVVYALVVWLASAALHDFVLIGLLLKTPLPPQTVFALAALNPVEAARVALLAGVDPQLSILGPVGFWLANRLGPTWALVIGVGWPALLGIGAMLLASRRFRRMDAVG